MEHEGTGSVAGVGGQLGVSAAVVPGVVACAGYLEVSSSWFHVVVGGVGWTC